jgi:hypothetical protein
VGIFAVAAGLFHALFVLGPAVETSLFRHTLWRYRDELVDAGIRGELPRTHPAVVDTIGLLEHLIAESRRFDLFWLFAAVSTAGKRPEVAPHPSYRGLSADVAARLRRIEDVATALVVRHAALGSPLSALTTVVLLPVVFFATVRAKAPDSDVGDSMRSATALSGPRRPLSAQL